MTKPIKRVRWSPSTKKELEALPKAVRRIIGHALWEAQLGKMPPDAKVLHGFSGASVLEIRADVKGDAYRAVYTVRFGDFIYVLHVFQKKSKKGSKTPSNIMELVRKRLQAAEEYHEQWKARKEGPN